MSDIDRVRKRPGMYVGDTDDGTGLLNMVCEVAQNAANEAGFADRVEVILRPGGSCTVRDNGRGIPIGFVEEEGMSGAEIIMTRLHAGSRYWKQNWDRPVGVGMCAVNALSEWLDLRIWQQEKEYHLRFLEGDRQGPLRLVGEAKGQQGTEISFLPSSRFFTNLTFSARQIEQRIAEMALLAPTINFALTDMR